MLCDIPSAQIPACFCCVYYLFWNHWGVYLPTTKSEKLRSVCFGFVIYNLDMSCHVISCYFSDGIHVLISSFGISIWMVRCTKKRAYLFQLSQVNSRERRPEPKKKICGVPPFSLDSNRVHRLGWFFRAWSGNSPCFLVNTIKVVNCSLLC